MTELATTMQRSRLSRRRRYRDRALTPVEMEVLIHVHRGYRRARIASDCGISIWQVSSAMRRVFDKLGADNRTQAVLFAIDLGVL